jgi:rhodanese-related sulfurtransferase
VPDDGETTAQQSKQQKSIHEKMLLTLTLALMGFAAAAAEFADVSIKEVKELTAAKKAVLLDVNGTESYQKGHVPGALDFAAIKDQLAASLPADKSTVIIAYCGSPKCKAYREAAEAAAKLGYTNVKHMSAGIKGWKEAGEPVEK